MDVEKGAKRVDRQRGMDKMREMNERRVERKD